MQAGLYFLLLPSLLFTYLGQAAFLVRFPDSISSLYYNSIPDPIYWPMFVIATLAAIVASQVLLSLLPIWQLPDSSISPVHKNMCPGTAVWNLYRCLVLKCPA